MDAGVNEMYNEVYNILKKYSDRQISNRILYENSVIEALTLYNSVLGSPKLEKSLEDFIKSLEINTIVELVFEGPIKFMQKALNASNEDFNMSF
jgi:hypothetical protein